MRQYVAIDLKSFYASVECVALGLNPLTTRLVVADASRTNKTICLAVSPALKAFGIGGRARLFEVEQRARQVGVDFLIAPPHMANYKKVSRQIYRIYRKYVAPEDIHVYSIDEVFMDVTNYLDAYRMTAHELTIQMIRDVLAQTGITATAGIGTNLYLAKVAMDIIAKHQPADKDGVRIAELDEMSYRRLLWDHRPLTDFWRVGKGTAQRLAPYGLDTMGKIARYSLQYEMMFFHLFGIHAELLIDHAWGWEPCTIEAIKAYKPENHSLSNSQVLTEPYTFVKARIVAQEMADSMSLRLVSKCLKTNQIVFTISYDTLSLADPSIRAKYDGPVTSDYYGRKVPRHSHGTVRLPRHTASARAIRKAVTELFDRTANPDLLVRRLSIAANNVVHETIVTEPPSTEQFDLFTDNEAAARKRQEAEEAIKKEHRLLKAQLAIKQRYGKNAILKGLDFEEGATTRQRNRQIGGHQE